MRTSLKATAAGETIKGPVKESWKRCQTMKLDPLTKASPPLLAAAEMEDRIKANQPLITVVWPFLTTLFHIVKDSDFRVDFADKEGCILKSLIPKSLISLCDKTHSYPGADRSEKAAGTNAIALALKTGRPVQVSGAEHYMQQFHRWSCSAAPIALKEGKVIGIINVAGHYEQVHRHTLGMVVAIAKAIENELYIQEMNDQLRMNNNQLSTILGMVSDGLVYVIEGRIKLVNEEMCALLGMKESDMLGKRAEEIIVTTPKLAKLLWDKQHDYTSREVVLEGKGRICSCLFDTRTVNGDRGKPEGEIMIFTRVEEIQMMAKKIVNSAKYTFSDIVGSSAAFLETIEMAQKAALFNSRIILQGESGTGKEMLAQAIHSYSARRHNPFVAVDCGAIPKELFESELFGYEGGAFTGASPGGKVGLIELADKGTLFLDEIGNMPIDLQAKLLRVLQEGVITKLGGTEKIEVDIRVIAATNADLLAEVEAGNFRSDLFYRLNVFHILVPSLAERREDIPLLTRYFINRNLGGKKEISIDTEAMQILMSYSWPGNIRELNNVTERAIIMSDGVKIKAKDLPLELLQERPNLFFGSPGQDMSLKQAMQGYILHVLSENKENISKTARVLGISRSKVYKAIKGNRERELYEK